MCRIKMYFSQNYCFAHSSYRLINAYKFELIQQLMPNSFFTKRCSIHLGSLQVKDKKR